MTRPAVPLDLSRPGRFHLVGVGGPGMNPLALVLAGMGHSVSGSDMRESDVLERLRAAGVAVTVGHDATLVHGVDAVGVSTAIPATNIEVAEAVRLGIAVLHRDGLLGSICAQARSIGVAGTHGKTTTTTMVTSILEAAGREPSYIIGGDPADLDAPGRWTGSEWFVIEADESDATHLGLPLAATILTNVEADHLENWGTLEAIVDGFRRYLDAIDGPKVICIDDPGAAALAAALAPGRDAVTYGLGASAHYRATDVSLGPGPLTFSVTGPGGTLGSFSLPLRGIHNVRNATGAIALTHRFGVEAEAARGALARFGGVARRFDVQGTAAGITFVDDYAHIPTEIAAVLEGAAVSGDGWRRIVAVFQPNRYRRMAILSPQYAHCFGRADLTVITDVYPSGDAPIAGVTGKLVVNAVLDHHPEQRVAWIPQRNELVDYLADQLQPGDLCISMGCGDIATLPRELIDRLSCEP